MPEEEPRSPARHYFLDGKITFHLEDRAITQNGELRLAAGDRMRFRIRQGEEHPNIFLLADPDQCWLKTGGAAYRAYDPLDLWIETTMRWLLLRFPWDWEPATRTPLGPEGLNTLAADFVLTTALGEIHLETDAEGFPKVASLRGHSVRVDDWHMATPSGKLVPLHWDWTSEQGRREEQFERFRDRAVLVDSSFLPDSAKEAMARAMPDAGNSAGTGDNLDVITLGFTYVEGPSPLGTRWTVSGEPRFVLQGSALERNTLPLQSMEARSWLAWGTQQVVSAEDAEDYLLSVLTELQLEADGPLWAQIDEDRPSRRRGFLLPVRPLRR